MCLRKRSSGGVVLAVLVCILAVVAVVLAVRLTNPEQPPVENGATNYQHPRPAAQPQTGEGENVGAEVPSDAINDYVGTWMGGIQQGFATMPFKFQFNDDMTVTVWPADEPVVNTTYEIVEGGKFLALFNNGTEAFQGSASQGETGKFLDFCYLAGISKDSTGRMRFTDQMCGTAQKR